jgi:hypothetical protein
MYKLKNIVIGIASFLAFFSYSAMGQATATGHVYAEVIEAITAVETAPMSFGRFSAGEEGGLISIPTSGASVTSSTVSVAGSEIAPATFSVSGAKNATFSVTLPEGPTTLTSLDGSGTLTVTGWSATSGDGSDNYVLAGGTQTVRVGATLQVGSADENPKGIYTGSYQVTFAYN